MAAASSQASEDQVQLEISFLDEALTELLADDALLVMAKGLGLESVLCRLVELHATPRHLVFLLNTTQEDERQLLQALDARRTQPGLMTPTVITNECAASERMELYLGGGVLIVTARILTVDMLCERVPIAQIGGLIVTNAHRVSDVSNMGFILRMFRQKNKTGFIKALSEDAQSFTRGFSKVEKVMRALFVRKLLLWPRFHLSVSETLSSSPPLVEELSVPLSKKTAKLQQALLVAVDSCLTELKSACRSVDVSQLSVENSLFKSFDQIVRMQLDPIWHRTSRRTRALVSDLQTLRQLLSHLVHSDSVTFFEHLESVFEAASAAHPTERPHWVLHNSEEVFLMARDRVYQLQRSQATFQKAPVPAPPASHKRQRLDSDGGEASGQAIATSSSDGVALGAGAASASGSKRPAVPTVTSVQLSRSVEGPANTQAPLSVSLVLEECPKWEALQQLLKELRQPDGASTCPWPAAAIPAAAPAPAASSAPPPPSQLPPESAAVASASEGAGKGPRRCGREDGGVAAPTAPTRGASRPQPGGVLLVVRDERAARTAKALLAHGARAVLEANLAKWVGRRRRSSQASGAVLSAKQHEAKLLRQAAERIAVRHEGQLVRPHALPSLQAPAAPEEPKVAFTTARGAPGAGASGVGASARAESGRESRRGRGRGGRKGRGGGRNETATGTEDSVEARGGTGGEAEGGDNEREGEPSDGLKPSGEEEAPLWELLPDEFLTLVLTTHRAAGLSLLAELQPRFVILYDPEPAWVRALEVEQARRASTGAPLQIYFLMLRDSVDEQRYRTALQHEKEAFEALIFAKGHMALPRDWDGKGAEMPQHLRLGAFAPSAASLANSSSRRAGGRSMQPKVPPSVVVDMREFRSALPNLLHLHGVTIHAITIEVGDYVLSPELCVERKSLSDLTQSLASGRLYNQAENMLRFYKRPLLLIEFDEARQFALINPSELGPEISPNSLMSKLTLLLIHFPRLRLLWSRRPLHTVSLFAALKETAPEPDPEVASALGAPNTTGADQVFNMTPQDVLRHLPGVYMHNCRRLMNSFSNLQELSASSCDRLAEVIGAPNAKKLHEFLNRTQ